MELWGYARKSTESEERQVQSIQAQKDWIINYCNNNWYTLLGIIEESKSAKQPWREGYNELMSKFTKKKWQGIVAWQLNRLARNPVDEWTIKWLVQQWIVQNIHTVDGISDGANILMMSVHFGMATQFIIDLSKNVKRWMKQKAEKWGIITRVPMWYLNDKNTNSALIDEDYSIYIKRIFELKTEWKTLKQIKEIVTKEWMRTKKNYRNGINRGGQALTEQSIDKIIKNPFYYWVIQHCKELYEGIHTPIIAKSIWDEANNITRGIEYRKHEDMSPLKWIVKLKHDEEETEIKLTTSKKKGHIYFHLSWFYAKKYYNLSISQKKLIQEFDDVVATWIYDIPSSAQDEIKSAIYDYHEHQILNNKEIKNKLTKESEKLEKEKKELIKMRRNWELTTEEFLDEKNILTNNIIEIHNEIQKAHLHDDNILEDMNNRLELLVSLSQSWKAYTEHQKVHFISNMCLELFVSKEKSLYIREKSLYKAIKFQNLSYGTATEISIELQNTYIRNVAKAIYHNFQSVSNEIVTNFI